MAAPKPSARIDAIRETVRQLAERSPVIAARVSGSGRFSNPGVRDAAYVNISAAALPELREELLCDLAQGAGVDVQSPHGFTPHITLAFVDPHEPHPLERAEPLPLQFGTLELWVGAHHDRFELQGSQDVPTPCDVTGGAVRTGTVEPLALAAVVFDWVDDAVTRLRDVPPDQRPRWLREALDDLHSEVLAAFLAMTGRLSGAGTRDGLIARAGRIRSVETDLNLILRTVAQDLGSELRTENGPVLHARLRSALRPLLDWAAAADEPEE